MNSGQKLWNEAKAVIPGGNQLLSKRCERFLPGIWPGYYTRAKGCEVWDLDDNHYFDFAQMGVGACILGYADSDVDGAVGEAIAKGSMCTLNAPEEVELAKKLVGLHPWSGMARFARTGGEACAIAVRIARAYTGKGRVAFCGYHGWSDWYLAANLAEDKALDGHLLPGLEPSGVFRGLKDSAVPFRYNNLDDLERIFAAHSDVGAIIMEPQRGSIPEPGFLEGVRGLADKHGAVLIFDEVTSGFRMNVGGIHLLYGIEPDMAVFAKALGNGYPIAAVIGKRAIMDAAQTTFISSTMWTERIGYVAALATIGKMERLGVQCSLIASGERVTAGWRTCAERQGIPVHIDGIPPLAHLSFVHDQASEMQTYFAQEMLKRGYLTGAAVYTTFAYTDDIIDAYIRDAGEVFAMIADALEQDNLRERLCGEVIQPGFKRLT